MTGEVSLAVPSSLDFGLLALLCAIAGSRWLLEGALPSTASTLGSEALGCSLVGLLFGLWRGMGVGRSGPKPVAGLAQSAGETVGTAMVVAGLAVANAVSPRHISSNSAALALALTPVVVAVCRSTAQEATGEGLPGLLWPGLAGLAGLLLLVPEPTLSGWQPWLALWAMPLLSGCGAHLLTRRGGDHAAARAGVSVWGCGLAAAVFVSLGSVELGKDLIQGTHFGAACLDGVCVGLSLVSLERLRDVRWSSQFLLVPLVALVEGVVFLRPLLDARSWVGLALLLLGAVRLLSQRGSDEGTSLHL